MLFKNKLINFSTLLLTALLLSDVTFSQTITFHPFDGAVRNVHEYRIPYTAESWAGFSAKALDDSSISPMSFPNGGTISFTARVATSGSGNINFKFERLPYNTEGNLAESTLPSFYTDSVNINNTEEQVYTIDIPAQSPSNTYASLILYINTLNKTLVLNNFQITIQQATVDCNPSLIAGELKIEAECYTGTLGEVQLEDTADIGGGQNVGWIDAFDSMIYSVNIPTSGNYQLSYRTASTTGSNLGFNVSKDNQLIDNFIVPSTGGWQNWQTQMGRVIALDAGQYDIRLDANDANMNINWFAFTQTSDPVSSPPASNNDISDKQPIDSSKWFHQTQIPNDYGWHNGEIQHYTDEINNSYVSDGTLKIVAIKEQYSDQGLTRQHTSARLNSKFAFKYGKVEFSAKMPVGNGTWPAVWLLNRNIIEPGAYWYNQYGTTSWPHCGEIDILEHWGSDPGFAQSALHNGDSSGATVHHSGQPVSNIFSEFHTYTMDWDASSMRFYVDGNWHYTYTGQPRSTARWPYDDPFYLILNVAIEPTISNSFTQSQMEIDWIRVYHHETDELLWSDEFSSDSDNDGVLDENDAFPDDPSEDTDSDGDGVGDNADAFPNDATENTDSDGDGVGDVADAFPDDASEDTDSDGDGVGDNADAYPNDPNQSVDSDNTNDDNQANPNPSESQIISVSNNPKAIRNGQVSLDIEYDVSSNNNELTGVGFRIHFDSSRLQFSEIQNLLLTDNIASATQSELDTGNFDNNPTTDSYITLAWASINADWPGVDLPTNLMTVVFDVNTETLNRIEYSPIEFSNTSSASGFGFITNSNEIKIMPANWDFDSNGEADALTDGLLFLRHSFNLRGSQLTSDATALDSVLSISEVENIINASASFADIDGDGQVDALSDGLLLLRYLFNVRGEPLTSDLISPNATRTTHSEIENYIHGHMPEQTIEMPDETPPQISLNGDSTFPLALDVSYAELGAVATDNRDGEVTVTVSGTVGDTIGTYLLTYTATDAAGNSSSVTRTVVVDEAPTLSSFEFLTSNNPQINDDISLIFEGNIISGRVDQNIPINDLTASFSCASDTAPVTTCASETVTVTDVEQIDGLTQNDFTQLVEYKVSKSNGVSKTYTVDLTKFTGLPIVNITTDNNLPIESKDDYITGTVTIDGGRGFEDLESTVMEIRGRGNSTWNFPKKPYQMKLDSKEKFLDMPKQKKWIFLAEYSDKSLLRNTIAFELGYLSTLDWTPKSEFAEVYINGDYRGTYNISEKVEEKSARVNIGDEGFLLEKDTNVDNRVDPDDVYFNTSVYQGDNIIVIKDPDIDRIDENDFSFQQDSRYIYITGYMNEFEEALFGDDFTNPETGYPNYLDVDNLIDWFLINEISKNVDAKSYSSIYFTHIPGEKIKMGPLWDFDLSFGNMDYAEPEHTYGWWVRNHAWISRLLEDPAFVTQVQDRFTNHYLANKQYILDKIDAKAEMLKWAQQENFNKWEILGVQVWPNPIDKVFSSYEEEVVSLKQWYEDRMDWIEQNISSI